VTIISSTALRRTAIADVNSNRLVGIGLMCTALACLSCLDCSAKWLGFHQIPLIEMLFVRYFVAFVLISVLFNPVRVSRPWHTPKLWLQTLRAIALLASTVCTYMSFRTMPLADIMAVNFALPLLIALLAGPILGERIGLKHWLAITVGFSGILVVTRPGAGALEPGILWCFGTVACNAFYQIATRRLSGIASTASMMLISTGLATAMIAPLVPSIWIAPHSTLEWFVLLIPGTFGAIGHYLLVRAFALAPAPIIAPFSYTQIAWSALLGLLVFGEMPGLYTVIGAGIVICSGLYLIYIETRPQHMVPETFASPAE
jgi:drug/metabolite transporter (DMT)-like permease